MKKIKRLVSILLVSAMLLSCISGVVFAEGEDFSFVLSTYAYNKETHLVEETEITEAEIGDVVIFRISLVNNTASIFQCAQVQTEVLYDADVFAPFIDVADEDGDGDFYAQSWSAIEKSGSNLGSINDGRIIFGYTNVGGVKISKNGGKLPLIQFALQVKEDVESSTESFVIDKEAQTKVGNTTSQLQTVDTSSTASVSVTGVAPTLTTVTLDGTASKTVTADAANDVTVNAKAFSAKGTDITGKVGWSVSPENQGVSIADGKITVSAKATEGEYTVTATPNGTDVLGSAIEKSLIVIRNAAAPVSLEISGGDESILVPAVGASGNTSTAFSATVTDQYDDTMESPSIEWTILDSEDNEVDGVSITDEGVVTVTDGAISSITDTNGVDLTITATCGDAIDTATITVKRDTPVLAAFAVDLDESSVDVPKDDSSKTVAARAINGKDQYDADYSLESETITYTLDKDYSGVSISGDTISVTKLASLLESTESTITVYASCGDVNAAPATLTVKHETLAAASIEINGVGDEDVIGVGSSKEYGATVKDQYGNTMDGQDVTWELTDNGDTTNITLSGSTVTVANDSAVDGKSAKLTATCNGKTDTVTITAKMVSVDFDSYFTQGDGITYGDSADKAFSKSSTSGCATAYISGVEVTDLAGEFTISPSDLSAGEGKTVTVTFTVTDERGYKGTTLTKDYTVNVAPKEVEVTWTNTEFVYSPDLNVLDSQTGLRATYLNLTSGDTDLTITRGVGFEVKAGTYTATADFDTNDTDASNYTLKESTAETEFTISAKTVDSPVIVVEPDSYKYTGSAITPTKVTVKDGETEIPSAEYALSYSDNENVGTGAKVIVTDEEGGNYTVSGSANFTITQATNSVMNPTIGGWKFDQSANAPEATATFGEPSFKYSTSASGTYSSNVPTDAGTYYVKAYVAATTNYTAAESAEATEFVISKADAPTVTATPQTLLSKDVVGTDSKEYSFDLSNILSEIPANAGTVSYARKSDGAHTGTVTIEDGKLKFTVATAQTAGTKDTVKVTVSSTNYENAEVEIEFEYKDKIDVTGKLTLAGITVSYGDNYTVAARYNGSTSSNFEYRYEGTTAAGVNYSGTNQPTEAGEYTITASYEDDTLEGEVPGHIGSTTATLTIYKKSVAKPSDSRTYVYNGQSQTFGVNTTSDYTVTGGTTQTNVGTYPLTVALDDTDNTEWSDGSTEDLNLSFVINAAKLTITADSYDITVGDELPKTLGYKVEGLFGSDKLTTEPTVHYEAAVEPIDTSKEGEYKILVDSAECTSNYYIEYVPGKLTIEEDVIEVLFPIIVNGGATQFNDISFYDYYYDAVDWAVQNGITTGLNAVTFGPDAVCTRAQVVTFLWRAAGSPIPYFVSNPFTDVNQTDYYYYAVLWAVQNGITKGVTATTFAPNAVVTRAQTVTFLSRLMGERKGFGTNFTDVKPGSYYVDAVGWAVAYGITKGVTADKFGPDAACTRAQIVTFLYRCFAR